MEQQQLNDKQKKILQYMAQGLASAAIAKKIGNTTSTVQSYRRKIYEILKVNNAVAAVLEGIKKGYITPPPEEKDKKTIVSKPEEPQSEEPQLE